MSFFATHVVVNNKPSEQATKACIAEEYLLPRFGEKALDEIHVKDFGLYKAITLRLGFGHFLTAPT
jgi:hypothetical protein